jgi:hypothetical protein
MASCPNRPRAGANWGTDPAACRPLLRPCHTLQPGFARLPERVMTGFTKGGRSEDEWRQLLDGERCRVLFQEGTEPPFSSPLNEEKRAGTFICAACHSAAVHQRWQVRQRHGLAQFFPAHRSGAHLKPGAISACCCRAPSTTARAAADTRATCSATGRRRPASATATTDSRCCSYPRASRCRNCAEARRQPQSAASCCSCSSSLARSRRSAA